MDTKTRRDGVILTGKRDRMRMQILKRVVSPPPFGTTTVRADEGVWQELAPGIHIKVLHEDPSTNTRSYFVRMEPGSRVPSRTHTQEEQCLVLEGEVTIGDHVMRSGDWRVARPESRHVDFWSKTGCLLFIRSELAARP